LTPSNGSDHFFSSPFLQTAASGSYGVVYKAFEKTTGEIVALKVVRSDDLNNGAKREVLALLDLAHPNIVK
jgi:serine/threonine protein kinase